MKLIFCPKCQDIIRLITSPRKCLCGKSEGWYLEDGWHAVIKGDAIAVGINNSSFAAAYRSRSIKADLGPDFRAFFFPENTERIRRE